LLARPYISLFRSALRGDLLRAIILPLQYRLIPSGRRQSRSTSRVRIVSVSRRHESEYHLQESMGTVVASSSHIVPTIRWKALPQILEAAQAKCTKQNKRERERRTRKEKEKERSGTRRRRAWGTGSFNIPTERPTDLPTYQPTT